MNNKLKICIKISFILILIFIATFFLFNKKEPLSKPINEDNGTNISTPDKKPIDTSTWTNYINNQLGFSIKIPIEVPTLYRCPDNKQNGNTPLKTYENNQNGIVYISQEYYYDANWSQPEQKFIGECDRITYSLESLENRENDNGLYIASSQKPFLGWKLIIKKVESDVDILKYIKENFGSGCIIKNKNSWNQDGVYEITIYGEDWDKKGTDLGNTTCPINFQYKILYSPEKNKLMSVVTGQECTFSSYQCYDEEMIKNFKFE